MTAPVLLERSEAAKMLHVSVRTVRRWGTLGLVENVQDPAGALAAMEAITTGLLAGVWPRDKGAAVLERIGLAVADLEAG